MAGTYRWIASYSGDTSNNAFATTCNEAGETSTVNKASPAMTTSATATHTAGGTIQDTATLSGGTNPAGTLSFSIYGPERKSTRLNSSHHQNPHAVLHLRKK